MNKSQISQLKNEIDQIKEKKIEVINQNAFLEQNQIPKGKKVYNIEASLMFVDVRNSTDKTDDIGKKNMVKIYQIFTLLCKTAIEENGGSILQIVGDGILAGFNNSKDLTAGRKAVNAAISIHTYLQNAYNPFAEDAWKIGCGIGIRTGHVYVTRLIVDDYSSQVAYPSSITNYASKLCGEAKSGDIIFDSKTNSQIAEDLKKLCQTHISNWGTFFKMEGVTWKIE
jgi:class 3 adenylate cyclase